VRLKIACRHDGIKYLVGVYVGFVVIATVIRFRGFKALWRLGE